MRQQSVQVGVEFSRWNPARAQSQRQHPDGQGAHALGADLHRILLGQQHALGTGWPGQLGVAGMVGLRQARLQAQVAEHVEEALRPGHAGHRPGALPQCGQARSLGRPARPPVLQAHRPTQPAPTQVASAARAGARRCRPRSVRSRRPARRQRRAARRATGEPLPTPRSSNTSTLKARGSRRCCRPSSRLTMS